MVVFTCAHCGESVKKNQVEKHHQITRCRNVLPSLTCVDCLKDFNGDEYIAHTSCVTEEERYSAKGFVSKPPSDKGKRKQEHWLHFIREIVDSNVHIDGHVKNLLERIAKDQGVPQKKPKFLNFCANKFKVYNRTVFEQTWQFLEKKREEMKNITSPQNDSQINEESCIGKEDRKRKRIDSNDDSLTDNTENKESDVGKHNCENVSKKKKKQKQDKQTNYGEPHHGQTDRVNAEAESKKKKKKSNVKNNYDQNGDVSVIDVNESLEQETKISVEAEAQDIEARGNECEQAKHLSKKEKKEKRKKEKYEKQLLEIQNQPAHSLEDEEQINSVEVKDKGKKKKKPQENGALNQMEVKTVGKKKQMQPDIENVAVENTEDIEDEEVADVKPAKFNWEETVVKLLESKGELPLKRVEKKIVNEYMNSAVHIEPIEKVIAKFNKKVLKMSRVKVRKEVVKLVS